MKGTPRSSKLLLKSIQSQSKAAGPIARLGSIFNHPILTDSESKVLLNEINATFRDALNESRHSNDIRPPASIHNAYANKVDHHIYKVLTDSPPPPPNAGSLRDLFSSEALADTTGRWEKHENSPISVFQNHLLQGTADLTLAVDCCKAFIRKILENPGSLDQDEGLRMLKMVRGNEVFSNKNDIPHGRLRSWMTAALLLSRKPTIPFQWLVQYLESGDVTNFRNSLAETIISYGKLYNNSRSPDEDTKFFVHMLNMRTKSYRLKVSDHPTTKASMCIESGTLIQLNSLLKGSEADPPLLAGIAERLYRRGSTEAKKMLADSLNMWDSQRTAFGAEVLIESGELLGAAKYLLSLAETSRQDSLSLSVVLGLLLVRGLREMHEEKALANRVVESVEKSLRLLLGGEGAAAISIRSIPERVFATWNGVNRSPDTDLYLATELAQLEKKIRASPE